MWNWRQVFPFVLSVWLFLNLTKYSVCIFVTMKQRFNFKWQGPTETAVGELHDMITFSVGTPDMLGASIPESHFMSVDYRWCLCLLRHMTSWSVALLNSFNAQHQSSLLVHFSDNRHRKLCKSQCVIMTDLPTATLSHSFARNILLLKHSKRSTRQRYLK